MHVAKMRRSIVAMQPAMAPAARREVAARGALPARERAARPVEAAAPAEQVDPGVQPVRVARAEPVAPRARAGPEDRVIDTSSAISRRGVFMRARIS
jgi:hypothetical protein